MKEAIVFLMLGSFFSGAFSQPTEQYKADFHLISETSAHISGKQNPNFGAVSDAEGNTYKTVKIGDMEWMAENLRTSLFCDSDTILFVPRSGINSFRTRPEDQPWGDLSVAGWSYFGGSVHSRDIHESREEINQYYGKLYNWYAASDPRNICPCGWRVPYEEEWQELVDYFGGSRQTFDAVKSNHDGFWKFSDSTETGSSGFEALAGGYRNLDGSYSHFGEMGNWWAQNEDKNDRSLGRGARLWFIPEIGQRSFQTSMGSKTLGYSVRCIKVRKGKDHLIIKPESARKKYGIKSGSGAKDIAGNPYNTLIIGGQEWFVENLQTHLYNNGDPIPEVSDSAAWRDATSGAMSSYQNNREFDKEYGKFYNGYVVEDERGVCPTGWRVASDGNWTTLLRAVGGKQTAGGVLVDKEVNFAPALAGFRNLWHGSVGQGLQSHFWTSSAHPLDKTYLFYYEISKAGHVHNASTQKNGGKSIRCVRAAK